MRTCGSIIQCQALKSAAINNVMLFFSCAGRSVASGPAMVDHPRLYGKKRDEDVLMVSCSVIKL